MTIGVLKEPSEESRVSFLPETVTALTKKGITVFVEPGAGEKAFHNDEEYVKAGAAIKSRTEIIQSADVLVAIHPFPEGGSPRPDVGRGGARGPPFPKGCAPESRP